MFEAALSDITEWFMDDAGWFVGAWILGTFGGAYLCTLWNPTWITELGEVAIWWTLLRMVVVLTVASVCGLIVWLSPMLFFLAGVTTIALSIVLLPAPLGSTSDWIAVLAS